VNDSTTVRRALDQYTSAYNRNDPALAPLAADVRYSGPMVAETVRGEDAVRRHIEDIAPFMQRMSLQRVVIDGADAAAVFEVIGINGVAMQGAEFFRCENGLIRDIQVYFDTGPLLRGNG
jgi:hypothetical protein